jgi:hypothetical protein
VLRSITPALLLLCACRSFVEPSPRLLDTLRAMPAPPAALRQTVRVTFESEWVAGEFDGVVVARTGERPAVRFQAFPDLGRKAIDLVASPERIAGWLPATRRGSDHATPLAGAPNAIDVLGIILLERFAAVDATRMREEDGAWWVRVRPQVHGLDVSVLVRADGTIARRRFERGWAAWDEEITPHGFSVTGYGMRFTVTVVESAPLDALPDGTFDLKIPGDARPLE